MDDRRLLSADVGMLSGTAEVRRDGRHAHDAPHPGADAWAPTACDEQVADVGPGEIWHAVAPYPVVLHPSERVD